MLQLLQLPLVMDMVAVMVPLQEALGMVMVALVLVEDSLPQVSIVAISMVILTTLRASVGPSRVNLLGPTLPQIWLLHLVLP